MKCSTVTSFKQTILHSAFSSADRTINEGLMMHCTTYTLNEGFEPTCTKCYCDDSKEALMIKAYYKSYHGAFLRVWFSFQKYHTLDWPLIKQNYSWWLNHKAEFCDYLLPVLQFFSNHFLQSLKRCMFLPYLYISSFHKHSTEKVFLNTNLSCLLGWHHSKYCNTLILIEKGLLFCSVPSDCWCLVSCFPPDWAFTLHL